jgi:hypothetical protein
MKHIDEVTQGLEAIPEPARKKKYVQTGSGIIVAIAGPVLVKWFDFPMWLGVGCFGFGCFIASKELLIAYLKFIPAAIRDVMNAARRTNNG